MEFRSLGSSGFKVPVLGFGTATFGGTDDFFRKWGTTGVMEARSLVDICLEAGLNFFDSADVYSGGAAEDILGQVIAGRRDKTLISTKVGNRNGPGPNDTGASRHHIVAACEASLRRLGTEYVDLLQLHGFDENTPIEETLGAFDVLIRSGKVRYVGASNFSGWHLMKALAAADRGGLARLVAHQVYYSLLSRDYENELMPLGADQGVGAIVWSPLSGGKLSGKFGRGRPTPAESRIAKTGASTEDPKLFDIMDVLSDISVNRGKTVAQVAINWLLRQPTVSSVIFGARTVVQLSENLGAIGWSLTSDEVARLSQASSTGAPYPYAHQKNFPELIRPYPANS